MTYLCLRWAKTLRVAMISKLRHDQIAGYSCVIFSTFGYHFYKLNWKDVQNFPIPWVWKSKIHPKKLDVLRIMLSFKHIILSFKPANQLLEWTQLEIEGRVYVQFIKSRLWQAKICNLHLIHHISKQWRTVLTIPKKVFSITSSKWVTQH